MVLACFILARAVLPFLPAHLWSPAGYLCGGAYLFLPTGKPHTCVAIAAFGEGARTANRLDFLSFRRETFTVDALGYRNPPLSSLHPRIILFGSSFSLGLSLSDDETLAAQLNQRLGPVVFNASQVLSPALSIDPIMKAAHAAGLTHGLVLLETISRIPYTYAPSRPPSLRDRVNEAAPSVQVFRRLLINPFALVRITSLLNMRIQNDQILPNPDRQIFTETGLRGGRRMLVYRDDFSFTTKPAPVQLTAESIKTLHHDLKANGFKLAVIVVPPAYAVYWPLLADPQPGDDPGAQYAASLASAVADAGIPVFNALPPLREAASAELPKGRLVYWPDDAHWNPTGVSVVAGQVAPWLKSLAGLDQDALQ